MSTTVSMTKPVLDELRSKVRDALQTTIANEAARFGNG